jgi:predicted nucleic acid-binding Zn ribbon protein
MLAPVTAQGRWARVMVFCPQCGKPVVVNQPNRKFCSTPCQRRFNRRRRKET